MIDYKLKSLVLKTDICKRLKYIDRNDFVKARDGIIYDKCNDDKYFDLLCDYDYKWIKEGRKINVATYKRIDRLKNRIRDYLLSGQCIFVTLTFDDDVLRDTSEKTRRQYVSRYLKSVSNRYVANIDYGSKNEREHYHAVVLTDYICDRWQYGFTWFERVHKANSEVCIAKYISKLCNHAIKESTKRCCYIYSRCV